MTITKYSETVKQKNINQLRFVIVVMATFWILFFGVCRTARVVGYGNSKRNAYITDNNNGMHAQERMRRERKRSRSLRLIFVNCKIHVLATEKSQRHKWHAIFMTVCITVAALHRGKTPFYFRWLNFWLPFKRDFSRVCMHRNTHYRNASTQRQ